MELWACGFNAWGQLNFEDQQPLAPHDLESFKCILQDRQIEILRTTLSATLVKTSLGLRIAGSQDEFLELCSCKGKSFLNLALAGNDKIAEVRSDTLHEYSNLAAYLSGRGRNLGKFKEITQIVAGQTTFTALSRSGSIWTWGDSRYEWSLGRRVSDENPASVPHPIEDLSDIPTGPIKNISSGGYVTAALSAGNDLYVWGGRPGQEKLLEQLEAVPTPVDLNGYDVLAISVGQDHMIALTTEQKLYIVGSGGNGQLGLNVDGTPDWTEILLPLKEGRRIVSVHAGYKNSFVLVEQIT